MWIMTKIKRDAKAQKQYYQVIVIAISLVCGMLIGVVILPPLLPPRILVETVVVTSSPEAYPSPDVNLSFIAPQESATSSIDVATEIAIMDSVPMCADVVRNAGGQYVFRIWLQQSMELYRLDEGGNNLCRLTNNHVNDDQPKWSPNGEEIAFVSALEGYGIYIMNADGTNITQVTTGGSAYSYPSWSPDGTKLIFQATIDEVFDIYRINVDGSNLQNLTKQERLDSMPVYSPDGQFIAFISDRIFNPYSIYNPLPQRRSYDIYMMNSDGHNAHRLTVTRGVETYPSWSPDSQQLVFVANYTEITIMNKDGSNIRQLTTGDYPIWLPDGQKIAFVQHHIYTMNPDGSNIQQVSQFDIPIGSGIQHLDYTIP
jgi:Tol biopolymer transport system component